MRGQKWLHPTSLASMLADHVSYRIDWVGAGSFPSLPSLGSLLGIWLVQLSSHSTVKTVFFSHIRLGAFGHVSESVGGRWWRLGTTWLASARERRLIVLAVVISILARHTVAGLLPGLRGREGGAAPGFESLEGQDATTGLYSVHKLMWLLL